MTDVPLHKKVKGWRNFYHGGSHGELPADLKHVEDEDLYTLSDDYTDTTKARRPKESFEIASAQDRTCQHCKIRFKPIRENEKYCWSQCPKRPGRKDLYA